MAGRNEEGVGGGVASGSRGQEKCQSRGLGWTQAASPGGHPWTPRHAEEGRAFEAACSPG